MLIRNEHKNLIYFHCKLTGRLSYLQDLPCRLTTGIHSEKCVVWRFRRCANVKECTYSNLDGTDMRRLTTGIRSEKRVVRRFRRCANVKECTYTNLDGTDMRHLTTGIRSEKRVVR